MKRMAAVLLAALALLGSGCTRDAGAQAQIFAMDTVMTLDVRGAGAQETLAECEALVYRLDALLSPGGQSSDVRRINEAGGEAVGVDGAVIDILSAASGISQRTDGTFDITISPVVKAWGFTGDSRRVPGARELAGLLPLIDYRKVCVSGNTVSVPAGMSIDLGGIAKGYTAAKLIELMRARGAASAIVSLGGNVQALGTRPDGTPWRVAIQDPVNASGYAAVLAVEDTAVVTSGGYQRYFEQDGIRYHHIIDPSTGYPADSGLLSVTVVCRDGMAADALSTAFYVMGMDKALAYRDAYGGFEAVFITDDGKLYYTDGLKGLISPFAGSGYEPEPVGGGA